MNSFPPFASGTYVVRKPSSCHCFSASGSKSSVSAVRTRFATLGLLSELKKSLGWELNQGVLCIGRQRGYPFGNKMSIVRRDDGERTSKAERCSGIASFVARCCEMTVS